MGQQTPDSPPPLQTQGLKSELYPPQIQRMWEQWSFDRLRGYHEMRSTAETLAINWLFTLNTGSLAGALTFASFRGLGEPILHSLIFSGAGIVILLIRAAGAYYRAQYGLYGAFSRDVQNFNDDKMTVEDLLERDQSRSKGSRGLYLLAVLAGIFFLAAFCFGFQAILESGTSDTHRLVI